MCSAHPLGLVALSLALAIALEAAAEECAGAAANATDCRSEGSRVEASEEESGYTWQELVAAIPQLKEFELNFSPAANAQAGENEGTYLLCQRVRAVDSRIKRRTCIPLMEYLAAITDSGSLSNDQRFLTNDILDRQSLRPVSSFTLRGN